MKREATQTIWRTVVFAGAMLGAPACTKSKPANTTPSNTTAPTTNGGQTDGDHTSPEQGSAGSPTPTTTTEPSDPCAGVERPRGTDDDGGGGVGRGFVLS